MRWKSISYTVIWWSVGYKVEKIIGTVVEPQESKDSLSAYEYHWIIELQISNNSMHYTDRLLYKSMHTLAQGVRMTPWLVWGNKIRI